MRAKQMQVEDLDRCNCCGGENIRVLDPINKLWICNTCEYIFDNPRPSLHVVRQFHTEKPAEFWVDREVDYKTMWKPRVSLIKKFISKGELLDVGAGTGQFLEIASKFFHVQGTELSEKAVNIVKKNEFDIYLGELDDIKFDKKFDIITIFDTLEFVPSPMETVKQCYENIKDGGFLIISVSNDVKVWKRLAKTMAGSMGLGKYKNIGFGIHDVSNSEEKSQMKFSHFSPYSLKYMVEKQGFSTQYQGPDPFLSNGYIKERLSYCLFSFVNRISRQNLHSSQVIVAKK